ncbi:MAG: hypothetical protein M3R06_05085 [Chloroflexota bacterium]|nr:hypothetical protein [Chloroflexota bacterium]
MSDGDGEDGNGTHEEERDPRAIREGGRGGSGFDPTPYLRQLRGRGGGKAQEYLDVKWRLLWLRREHPNAEITTEHIRLDESSAIFRATVILPTGGSATGYGSETATDFPDFIEKAETKAIGRALNALGYGAQFTEGEEEGASEASASSQSSPPARSAAAVTTSSPPTPTPTATPPARPAPVAAPHPAPASTPSAPSRGSGSGSNRGSVRSSSATSATPRRDAPIDIDQHRERATSASAASSPAAETGASAEPDLADFSWTAFWQWARPIGYTNKPDLEAAIGRTIDGLTPADVRALIRTTRGET